MAARKQPSTDAFIALMAAFRDHAQVMRHRGAQQVTCDFQGLMFHAAWEEGTSPCHVGGVVDSSEEEDEDDGGDIGFH